MFGRRCIKFAPVAVAITILAALPAAAHADAITTLFNTGVDASGMLRNDDASEMHYALVSVPSGTTDLRVARSSSNTFPFPNWIADSYTSAWIGPNSGNAMSGVPGDYDYRTTFDLTGFNAATASIKGQWSADNYGVDIFLNGVSTQNTASDFRSFYNLSIISGFIDGVNSLVFRVNNAPGAELNPTGLRTELVGKADVPEPASMALLGAGLLGLIFARSKRA